MMEMSSIETYFQIINADAVAINGHYLTFEYLNSKGKSEMEYLVNCSLCGKAIYEEDAIYVEKDGDKPRPYCVDCNELDDDCDE
jgi:hypothetical protein